MVTFIDWLHNTSIIRKLALVNLMVFLTLHIGSAVCNIAGFDTDVFSKPIWLGCPSSILQLGLRPWTLLTYAFTQYSTVHVLLNTLWLIWFGRLAEEAGLSGKHFLILYLIAAICASLAYIVWLEAIHRTGPLLIGSSASVLAIGCAVAVIRPRSQVEIPLLPSIPLVIPVAVIVLADILLIDDNSQGGHIAHMAGVVAGITAGIIWRRKMVVNEIASSDPIKDTINSKIITSGFESLTSEERTMLLDDSLSSKSYNEK